MSVLEGLDELAFHVDVVGVVLFPLFVAVIHFDENVFSLA